MDLGIEDRVAVIGGASKGLGRACATQLAAEGANLVIPCRKGEGDVYPPDVTRACKL